MGWLSGSARVPLHITRVSKGVCACCMYTDYGLDVLDPNDVPRGPKFIDQPDNIMAVEGIASVVIDCTAAANPSPTYRMYKILVNNTIPITTDMDPRCTTIYFSALLSFSFSLHLFLCLYTRPSVFICILASYTNIYLVKSYILVSSTLCHVKSSVLFRVLQFGNTPR